MILENVYDIKKVQWEKRIHFSFSQFHLSCTRLCNIKCPWKYENMFKNNKILVIVSISKWFLREKKNILSIHRSNNFKQIGTMFTFSTFFICLFNLQTVKIDLKHCILIFNLMASLLWCWMGLKPLSPSDQNTYTECANSTW